MKTFSKPNFKKMGRGIVHLVTTFCEVILFAVGLALVSYGFWGWFQPLSFILPGAILVYIAMPDSNAEPKQ